MYSINVVSDYVSKITFPDATFFFDTRIKPLL